MSEGPEADRIARLVALLEELPFEEREAAIAALQHEDRTAVLEAEAQADQEVLPEEDELGGEA